MQGLAHQGLALVPDRWSCLAEGLVQRHALAVLLGQVGQQAQLTCQGPENDRWLDTFATQAFKHAQGVGGFAVENGVDQAEHVKPRAVGHGRLHGFNCYLVVFGQQLELFDFLGGSQQVAFNAGSDQLDGILLRSQACLRQALAYPLGQLVGIDRPDLYELGVCAFDQRLAPLGFLGATIEFRQADQQQRIFGGARAIFDQRRGTLVAGLARRQAQFQQAPLRKQ
ncbi:hypothetical protein D9M71_583040 [compost metagenome]